MYITITNITRTRARGLPLYQFHLHAYRGGPARASSKPLPNLEAVKTNAEGLFMDRIPWVSLEPRTGLRGIPILEAEYPIR